VEQQQETKQETVDKNTDKFEVVAISANKSVDLLLEQIIEFKPKYVVVYDRESAEKLKNLIPKYIDIEVLDSMEGLVKISTLDEVDIVLTAVVGMIGLIPTVKAIEHKKDIALANKETLVTAGEIVMKAAKENGVNILPVDSEHSAIFQCLNGENKKQVNKLILTASGGPFRGKTREELINVTKREALKHPNWSMGQKITIDSSTLMNKGLEVIEANWLFDVDYKNIDVVVHPQSIIHSMVEYIDTSVIAQLSMPDMRLAIEYALTYPNRIASDFERIDFSKISKLTFEEPDINTFPCLKLAYDALKEGKTYLTVLNASNEVLVESFLRDKIGFYDIPYYIEKSLDAHNSISNPTLDDILEVDIWTRNYVKNLLK
ncbi:1-deoxy-D-xylulose-5-phosphate reductoisomerase, partial [Intestinibacter sp.]|uniref:1-deoxy-D-xylulose-5-phosphate reductoisomerase n=1 Tax=Intestinibacter sp. TaxID=1965304 RepID=UPI003F148F1C